MVLASIGMSYIFHHKFLRPRWVYNEAGFEVRFVGMLEVRYSEKRGSVNFWAEPVVLERGEFKGRRGWLVGISKPSDWSDNTSLNDAEKKTVQDRTRDALQFMRVPYLEN